MSDTRNWTKSIGNPPIAFLEIITMRPRKAVTKYFATLREILIASSFFFVGFVLNSFNPSHFLGNWNQLCAYWPNLTQFVLLALLIVRNHGTQAAPQAASTSTHSSPRQHIILCKFGLFYTSQLNLERSLYPKINTQYVWFQPQRIARWRQLNSRYRSGQNCDWR